ncbi:MAG: MarR family winged helix-turn-helix transcriptional regulator [Candidatus Limnocylindrales bacterium]
MNRLSERELAAWQALLHAHDKVTRRLDTELRVEHGISLGDYDVLVRLARAADRRLRMTDLAQRAMLSPSSLTRVVDRLVAGGLVGRDRSITDTRVVHATLTDAGRARVRAAARTHLRGIRAHFTGLLTEEQLDEVAATLGVVAGPHQPH